jgi:hypothetical protein
MTDDLELDSASRAYLRTRGDVAVPAGLLDAVREQALAPAGRPAPRWLRIGLGVAAAVAVLVVGATIALRPGPLPSGAGAVGNACPITVPSETFVPPPAWPAAPPAYYGTRWYGTADLWTMLPSDGAVSESLSRGDKLWWFSTHFTDPSRESSPPIAVTGRLLDLGAPTITVADKGTNASADFGLAILVGGKVPSAGCWELTATYKGHALSYVVLVE